MSLKRVNFSPLHTFARATVKNVFQPEPDGFGGTDYILKEVASGAPAFAWNPATGESLGISIEEARTNLATRNKADANALDTGTKTNVTVATVADPKFGNVIELTDDATDAVHLVTLDGSADSVVRSRSVYVKAPTANSIPYAVVSSRVGVDITNFNLVINLATGAYTSIGASIAGLAVENFGNGWYRIGFSVAQTNASTRAFTIALSESESGATTTYAGTGKKLLIALPQWETGTNASSPIETEATTVTRLADVVTVPDLSGWFNPLQWSITIDFSLDVRKNFQGLVWFSNLLNTDSRGIGISVNSDAVTPTVPKVNVQVRGNDGVLGAISQNAIGKVYGDQITAKITRSGNVYTLSVDGQASVSLTHTGVDPLVEKLNIGVQNAAGASGEGGRMNGTIGSIKYYPVAGA